MLIIVATRANALWQSHSSIIPHYKLQSRNPRECAVAKGVSRTPKHSRDPVATRANALWQRSCLTVVIIARSVATRANALWQRSIDTDKTCPPFRRNPRECAVAKCGLVIVKSTTLESQPARMRCGKGSRLPGGSWARASQPARMRCGKVACKQACKIRTSRNPRECAVAKFPRLLAVKGSMESQPARMR